ncbi:hypothetical protein MTR67_001635 [Solanum verrucosum]|uniref:Uncharacterized protein n=1 Tax=Solanum verrucosum TaxID=315347 RepID=A0AAF0PS79_SOLVR|nr:hypothetical protein MTR67_001635 [Solanum verrucosum]
MSIKILDSVYSPMIPLCLSKLLLYGSFSNRILIFTAMCCILLP